MQMQGDSLVSVIVPVYKVEDYLERCVNSIRSQTYRNLEIILVDDGSPDNCGRICDFYAKADSRVKVIHKPNGGLSDARNAGIECATGEYIAFIDSDDWIDEDMIELLYKMIIKHNADIAECSYRNVYDDSIEEETNSTGEQIVGDNVFALEKMLEWKYFKPVVWNKLYRYSVIGDVRYPVGKIHEDEFTTYKYMYAAHKLVYVDVSKYNYKRGRKNSITGAVFTEQGFDACEAYRERVDFFREHGLCDLEEKINNAYFWILFNCLDRYIKQGIEGKRIHLLVEQARKDLKYFRSRPLNRAYYDKLALFSQGIDVYKEYYCGEAAKKES